MANDALLGRDYTGAKKYYSRPGVVLPVFTTPVKGFRAASRMPIDNEQVLSRASMSTTAGAGRQHGSANSLLRGWSWYDSVWANKIQIIPQKFAAGNLLSAVQTTYEVYNSGNSGVLFNSKSQVTLDGVTEISGQAPVATLGGKESWFYVVQIEVTGSPSISGYILHDFATNDVQFNITANRVAVVGYEPELPFTERWEWATSVMQGYDGTEQRVSIRHMPKQSLVYMFRSGDEIRNTKIEMLVRGQAGGTLALPIWHLATTISSPVTAGDLVINTGATANLDFRTGVDQGYALIFVSESVVEAVGITTVGATSLTLTNAVLGSYPIGTKIMPLRLTQMTDGMSEMLYKVNARELLLQFDVAEGADFGSESGFTTYLTYPVFEDVLTLSGDSYNRMFDFQMIEGGSRASRNKRRTGRRYPLVKSSYTMRWSSFAAYVRARAWINARRGMQKVFWLPSNRFDFQVHTTTNSPTPIFNAIETGYARLFGYGQYKWIRVQYTNGVIDYRQVTSVANTAGKDVITVTANFSQTISAANVTKASMLILHRLDSDAIDFTHDYLWEGELLMPIVEVIE